MIRAVIEGTKVERPTLRLFEIIATSDDQKEDEGWYFYLSFNGREVSEPMGPFPTESGAVDAGIQKLN